MREPYEPANPTVSAEPLFSVLDEMGRLQGRAADICSRLEKLEELLFGGRPHGVGMQSAEAMKPNIKRGLERAHGALTDIEAVLSRIEAQC